MHRHQKVLVALECAYYNAYEGVHGCGLVRVPVLACARVRQSACVLVDVGVGGRTGVCASVLACMRTSVSAFIYV